MFLPHIMAGQSALGQTALSQLKRTQAQKGISQSPISGSQQLGLSANLGNNALAQAFQNAMGLAGQRAGVWSGQQPFQTQPNLFMANAMQQGIQQGLLAQALSRGASRPQQAAPYVPDIPNWGLPTQYSNFLY